MLWQIVFMDIKLSCSSKMFLKYGYKEVEEIKWDNAAASVLNVYKQLV